MAEEKIHKREGAEILYKKTAIFERENQCLKNEVKNQPSVPEMFIMRDQCGNEWEEVKKIKSRRIPIW